MSASPIPPAIPSARSKIEGKIHAHKRGGKNVSKDKKTPPLILNPSAKKSTNEKETPRTDVIIAKSANPCPNKMIQGLSKLSSKQSLILKKR